MFSGGKNHLEDLFFCKKLIDLIVTIGNILLMAELLHQLRLVVYPVIYRVSAPSQVVSQISAINSIIKVRCTNLEISRPGRIHLLTIPRNPVVFSDDEQGVSNHLLIIVFRFHYHSQKAIGCLGYINFKPSFSQRVSTKLGLPSSDSSMGKPLLVTRQNLGPLLKV